VQQGNGLWVAVETKTGGILCNKCVEVRRTHLELTEPVINDTVQHILFVEVCYNQSEYQIAFSRGFSAL